MVRWFRKASRIRERQLFEKAAKIIDDQRSRNPQLNVLFENTEIHPGLSERR